MATKLGTDLFTSQAELTVTESASNTLTFTKLETGLSVYDKIGWVIARVEWRPSSGTYALFNGTGDVLDCALTMSNGLTALSESDPAIYNFRKFLRLDFGTAANASIFSSTYIDDFSTLPGGGLLVLPNPLYLGIKGTGLTAGATMFTRIFFKAIELSDQDYFNLVQARQLLITT